MTDLCKLCSEEAEMICQICKPEAIFCFSHFKQHRKETDHDLKTYNPGINQSLKNLHAVKEEIEKQVMKIQIETLNVISEIKKLSNQVIKNFKEMNKNIKYVQSIKPIRFDKLSISNILENFGYIAPNNEENKRQEQNRASLSQKFNLMSFSQKKKYAISKWSKISISSNVKGLYMSNDDKFLFQCQFK